MKTPTYCWASIREAGYRINHQFEASYPSQLGEEAKNEPFAHFFMASYEQNGFITAVRTNIKEQSFQWIFSPKHDQSFFRLVISPNSVLGFFSKQEQVISVQKNKNEALLVLTMSQELFLPFMSHKQYESLAYFVHINESLQGEFRKEAADFFAFFHIEDFLVLSSKMAFESCLYKLVRMILFPYRSHFENPEYSTATKIKTISQPIISIYN